MTYFYNSLKYEAIHRWIQVNRSINGEGGFRWRACASSLLCRKRSTNNGDVLMRTSCYDLRFLQQHVVQIFSKICFPIFTTVLRIWVSAEIQNDASALSWLCHFNIMKANVPYWKNNIKRKLKNKTRSESSRRRRRSNKTKKKQQEEKQAEEVISFFTSSLFSFLFFRYFLFFSLLSFTFFCIGSETQTIPNAASTISSMRFTIHVPQLPSDFPANSCRMKWTMYKNNIIASAVSPTQPALQAHRVNLEESLEDVKCRRVFRKKSSE